MADPSAFGAESAAPESLARTNVHVTPAMIDAGVAEFARWQESDDYSAQNLVVAIYLAMRAKDSPQAAEAVETLNNHGDVQSHKRDPQEQDR